MWMVHTINFGTRMDDAALGMCKHGVITSIFLAEVCFLVLAFNYIVYLHTIVALRGKEQASKIVKVDGQNGILKRRSLAESRS